MNNICPTYIVIDSVAHILTSDSNKSAANLRFTLVPIRVAHAVLDEIFRLRRLYFYRSKLSVQVYDVGRRLKRLQPTRNSLNSH